MHSVAFIAEAAALRQILVHLGEPTSPPRLAAARGPPLWEMPDAGQRGSDPRPNRHQIAHSISASRGKNSSTRIRSRSTGTARAMGHQSCLVGHPVGHRQYLRCNSGAVFTSAA